jgi:hypothetical protein
VIDLTDEELAKIALTPTDEIDKIITKLDPAQKFCIENNIRRGKEKISAQLIYDLYYTWKKSKRLPQLTFFIYFSKHFEKARNRDATYYYLDPEPFDLSPEKHWEIRKRLREEHFRKRKNREVHEENVARDRSLEKNTKIG